MKKGRDIELIQKRDAALLKRYYHWTEVQRLRFDDALKILSEQEFFISEERIMHILRKAKQKVVPAPAKNKFPRLTFTQLSLFSDDAGMPIGQIHHDSKTEK